MKSLLLVRHAKSSWDFDVDDFDRPLNARGKSDAPEMALRLLNRQIPIDAFISSPARRALSTAEEFARAYQRTFNSVEIVPSLYEAGIPVFRSVVEGIDEKIQTAAIFCHNPGITDFANTLTATRLDDMPTCGIFAVHIHSDKWSDFLEAKKDFWFFDYPKLR